MSRADDELSAMSIAECLAAYRKRTLSPVELTRAYLGRIEMLDPELHAYVEVFGSSAMAQARASEARLMSGMPMGMLEGIPLGLKDLLHLEGYTTTAGSSMFIGRGPERTTATAAARLLGAGAIMLGKTQLVEFAYGGWGTNQGMGTPRNPWDMTVSRAPGGSSSGSAVAVAAGLAAGAIGTDTGGSVRIPSAFCGLTGLKTTQGRVSNYGVEYVSRTLDTIGPMVKSAEDAALMLQAIHGPDHADPVTLCAVPQDFISGIRDSIGGTRISIIDPALWGVVDDEALHAVSTAAEAFADMGCLRNDAAVRHMDFSADQEETGIIISCEAYGNRGEALAEKPEGGDFASRERIMSGSGISAARYANAIHNRNVRKLEFARIFDNTDVLILPTVPCVAAALADLDERDLSPSRLTRFVGYYGLCAISLPCGFGRHGLPLGLQLVAAPFREDLLLRLGFAFQQATDFHTRLPLGGNKKKTN